MSIELLLPRAEIVYEKGSPKGYGRREVVIDGRRRTGNHLHAPDRLALVQQLKVRESAWRKVADCYRAMRAMPEPGGHDSDTKLRIAELDKGIANAETKARETAEEIAGWEQPC